jgi:branched-chain amino acid transport system substrate-binding protein
MKKILRIIGLFSLTFMTGCGSNYNTAFEGFGWQSDQSSDAPPSSLDYEDILSTETTTSSNKIKVGLLLPLSGKGASMGKAMLNASQLAMMELNSKNLVLVPADTKSTPSGAKKGMKTLLAKNVKLVIGPLYSNNLAAVTPMTEDRNIPIIALSNDMYQANSRVFMMGFSPDDQVRRIVKYAHDQGKTRFAILTPDTAYGRAVKEEASQAISYLNDDIVISETYPAQTRDFTDIIKRITKYEDRKSALNEEIKELAAIGDDASKEKIKQLENQSSVGEVDYDAVILAEGKDRIFSIAPLFPYYDVDTRDIKLLGTGLWDEPGTHREPALFGAWYAAPPLKEKQEFDTRYTNAFGSNPPRLASLAYDATALAAVLSRKGGSNPFTLSKLTNRNGFEGTDGIFRLLPDGRVERGLAVLALQPKGPIIIDGAPASF